MSSKSPKMFSQVVIPWKNLPNISQTSPNTFFLNNKLGDDIIPRRIIITVITHLVITKALPQRAVAEDGIQGWDQGA